MLVMRGARLLLLVLCASPVLMSAVEGLSSNHMPDDATKVHTFWHHKSKFAFCHHRSTCGSRAQPGLQVSLQDPTQSDDGLSCFCQGKFPNGQDNGRCYRGTCDYGKAHIGLRGQPSDEVLDFFGTRDREDGDPNTSAETKGLCKFEQVLENLVDMSLCMKHLTQSMQDTNDGAYTEKIPRDYQALNDMIEKNDGEGLPLSPQDRLDLKVLNYLKVKDREEQDA